MVNINNLTFDIGNLIHEISNEKLVLVVLIRAFQFSFVVFKKKNLRNEDNDDNVYDNTDYDKDDNSNKDNDDNNNNVLDCVLPGAEESPVPENPRGPTLYCIVTTMTS